MKLQTENSLSVSSTHSPESRLSLLQTRTMRLKVMARVFIDYAFRLGQSITTRNSFWFAG